ncbi:hypothetical protein LBMAG52_08480 [Planctomycetia bacterium]|nr:hypothetical protein LBMAG52_08480 [Planctomycetia bacterium]
MLADSTTMGSITTGLRTFLLTGCVWAMTSGLAVRADSTLVADGQPRAAVFVSERVWDDATKNPEPAGVWRSLMPEDNRRRLRESVRDLVGVVERMSGAKLPVEVGAPKAGDARVAILIGELATAKFGLPAKKAEYQQGLRIVVGNNTVGLIGESDLATSYAVYTLLDQLGCRWFLPSAMGEVLPISKTITLKEQDVSTAPYTIDRSLTYSDNDFARRNRLGGMELSAGHALEFAVPKELRTQHPEIKAIIGGKPHDHYVKWTHPLVAEAITKTLLDKLAKEPETKTLSLSPDDGATWDESDDTKFDAGDFDPSLQTVAKADRLMVLCNRIAAAIAPKYPDVKFGMLAYVDYTRPPVREKPHPAIVPQIAPITFTRAHPLNDPGEPNNKSFQQLIEGWGKVVPATSYYFYGFYLAEVSSPNPMLTKWGHDIPFIYQRGACRYWQPETLTNFDTSLHAHWLGLRMAWDPSQKPEAIVDEINSRLYGHAGAAMSAYWRHIDDTWVKVPEYAGCGFGHLRRWNVEKLTEARRLMNAGRAACTADAETARVKLADDSLAAFEMLMQQRRDLADGRWSTLAEQVTAYRDRMIELGKQYEPQFAFTKMGWTGEKTLNVIYFDVFYGATHNDAARVAKQFNVIAAPLKQWRFQTDKDKTGEAAGWSKPDFDDSAWKTTDCVVDTWSSLGLHNYMGSAWYRMKVKLPPLIAGKKTFLWIGATDGRVKVFVNGQHVPHINDKGEKADSVSGHCQPFSFDISAAAKPDAENSISLFCTREIVNELGTGGLLAPAAVYSEK